MRQLSDGTTSVTAEADPVGYWPDLSGNGYHATQSTNNNRPTYRAGVRNGRSVLRFDGSNDSYQVASFPLDAVFSVFAVCKFASASSGNLWFEHSVNSNTNSGMFISGLSNSPIQTHRTVAPAFRALTVGVTNWFGADWGVAEGRVTAGDPLNAIDSVLAYWKNGTRQSNSPTSLVPFGTVTSGRSVTATLFIGSRNQASNFSNGDYAEILIYNRPLTDSEHTSVRRYLGSKWGVTVA
jgi:hypothetical protein